MGMGIFAGRKIALLNQINNFEMQIMKFSSDQMNLADQAAQLTINQNNGKLNLTNIGSMLNGSQQGAGPQNPWGLVAGGIGMAGQATGGIMAAAGASSGAMQWAGGITQGLGALAGIAGGIFAHNHNKPKKNNNGLQDSYMDALKDQTNIDNKLVEIGQKEKRLQMKMKRMETLLSAANKEYDSVVKAEEQSIKRATPKFGG